MPNNQQSEEILKQLRHVASMVMQAAEANSMQQMFQNIANIARELIGARYAALGIPDQNGGLRFFKVSGMTRDQIEKIEHPPVGLGLLGKIMRDMDPLRLKHLADHPEAVGFPEGHPEMESFIGVPIKLGDQLYGIFYLTDKEDGTDFTEDDQWLLEIMSGYAALAIAEKNLQDQRHQITLMREREQIGMTLHDGVIQSIYALGMKLDLARRNGDVTDKDVDFTLNGLNQVIEDIRSAIFQLKDENNEAVSLRRRLKRIIDNLYIPRELAIDFQLPEQTIPLEDNMTEALDMMLTECLSNVIRHAQASKVTIRARESTDAIHVSIMDDGVGFDPTILENQSGLGLRNLQRRARIHGGNVDIYSNPEQGTQVNIHLPLD